MFDNLDIKNFKLTQKHHSMKKKDFNDMLNVYNKYKGSKDPNKIPCLLFYADEDEYVKDAFNQDISKIKKVENIEELAKNIDQGPKYKTEELKIDATLEAELKKFENENEKLIEKEIQEKTGNKDFKLDLSVSKKNIKKGKRAYVLNFDNNKNKEEKEKQREKEREKENENEEKDEKKDENTTSTPTKKKYCNYKN